MNVRSFFDTNILIYADDKSAPAKQRRAIDLVAEHRRAGTGVVSMLVLQEYFVTATRPDVGDILGAIDLHRLHTFSFWDALILRSAIRSGCSVLLTEVFQESREVDGVRIVNPFTTP